MHDGQNLYDPAAAAYHVAWMVQDSANQLIVAGQTEEVSTAKPSGG